MAEDHGKKWEKKIACIVVELEEILIQNSGLYHVTIAVEVVELPIVEQ
jgi:hypothetical protein